MEVDAGTQRGFPAAIQSLDDRVTAELALGSGRPAPPRALLLLRPRIPLLPALRRPRCANGPCGRALSVVSQRVGLGVSCKVVLAEAVSSAALAHPGQVLVRGLCGSAEAFLWNYPQGRVCHSPCQLSSENGATTFWFAPLTAHR